MPLEELAALFGDTDEVAVYQAEIDLDSDPKATGNEKLGAVHVETSTPNV